MNKKIKVVMLVICLFASTSYFISEHANANALYTEVEFVPQIVSTTNLSRVTIGLRVIPQDGQTIDTVQTNLVTFSEDKLQFVGTGVTWGNLFSSGLVKIDGTPDNNAGTVKNIIWGSTNPASSPGYLYYMTFDIIGSGIAYVDVDYAKLGIARNGYPLPKQINSNCTFYISEIPTTPTLNAYVNGSKQIDFDWVLGEGADTTYIEYSKFPGPWALGEKTMIYNSTGTEFQHTNLTPLTTYYYQIWSWNETFGRYSEYNISIEKTTLNNIPEMSDPAPNNNYASVYTEYMSVYAWDEDDDVIDVSFYWDVGDVLIHTFTNVSSYSTVNLYIPDYIPGDWLVHNTNYDWYVILTDGREVYTSGTLTFRTSKAWDINEDGIINYLDVSSLAAHYLKYVTPPGSEGWDINNDGIVNYLDASSLVAHYLETY